MMAVNTSDCGLNQVLPKMVDILGSNIYCWHQFTPCPRPAAPGTAMPASYDELPRFGWHRDGGFE